MSSASTSPIWPSSKTNATRASSIANPIPVTFAAEPLDFLPPPTPAPTPVIDNDPDDGTPSAA